MAEIKINILPQEFYAPKKEENRKKLILNLSLFMLVLMVAVTVTVLLLGLFRNMNIKNLEKEFEDSKNKTAALKENEVLISVLKQRASAISSIQKTESPQAKAFSLVTNLLPSQANLSSFSGDKSGRIEIGGEASNTRALQQFLDRLTDPGTSEGVIKETKVSSVAMTAAGLLRFNLTFELK